MLLSASRSSTFLAFFVSSFQAYMCMYYHLFPNKTTKYIIHPFGFLAGLWILLEQKSRRAELAMFVLPKAMSSVYAIMIKYGLPELRGLEVIGACCSTSILMSLYQTEPEHISGMLFKLMKQTLGEY